MTVAATTNNQASLVAGLNSASTSAATATQELSDRFLTLLVTQLKNQDPMNPMDNAELTSQLAQMSTVEEIGKLNVSMDGLVSQFRADQVLQGASLVGRQVLAEGSVLNLASTGAAGGFDLATSADSVKVTVKDASGAVVSLVDMGAQPAGFSRFAWDGLDATGRALPVGEYSFSVEASAAGKSVASGTYSLGGVISVALNGDVMDVEVSGLGNRSMDQIKQIF